MVGTATITSLDTYASKASNGAAARVNVPDDGVSSAGSLSGGGIVGAAAAALERADAALGGTRTAVGRIGGGGTGLKGGTTSVCFVDPKRVAQSVVGSELLSLVARLQTFGGGVWNLAEHRGASQEDFGTWESNAGVKLPQDLRDFLSGTDGIAVRWVAPLDGKLCDVGALTINPLKKITQVFPKSRVKGQTPNYATSPLPKGALPQGTVAAFALCETKSFGLTALVYKSGTATSFTATFDANGERRLIPEHPQIWFRGLSNEWHFLAECFSDYMRLVFVHFGVKGWQYAFTEVGPDPEAEQWLRLLCPGRFLIDLDRALFPQRVFTSNAIGVQIEEEEIQAQESGTSQRPEIEPAKWSAPLVRLAYLDTIESRPVPSKEGPNISHSRQQQKRLEKPRNTSIGKVRRGSKSNGSRIKRKQAQQ